MVASENLELGALVRHRERPGVWRVLGLGGVWTKIEPWDDAAAAAYHESEAYVITARVQLLSRLRPGGATRTPLRTAEAVA